MSKNNDNGVWGKNPKLEKFWTDLATGKIVVVIYKNKHKTVNLPNRKTKKYKTIFDELNNNPDVISILTSAQSSDAYELYLYPKAKNKSVKYVIEHYKRYFKPMQSKDAFYKKMRSV